MNCKQLRGRIDDYSDGLMNAAEILALQSHAAACSSCRQKLLEQDELIQSLRGMPVPSMRPGFAPQALRRAVEQKRHHRRGFATGFSSALAAGVAFWLVVTAMLPGADPVQPSLQPQAQGVEQVQLALYQESMVNLVFFSPKQVGSATLSLELPENVEVVGFPGERVISWQTALSEGQNILSLPLRANALVSSELLASIESGGSKKSFRLQIGVSNQERSEVPKYVLKNLV